MVSSHETVSTSSGFRSGWGMKHQSSSESLSSSSSLSGDASWKKSIVYRLPAIDMSNLTILATAIASRFEELVSVKHLLDSSPVMSKREREASLLTYIQLASTIFTLGRGICKSWKPVAESCKDEILKAHLLASLCRVETMSVGLKTAIGVRQRRNDVGEGDDAILPGAQNVVLAAKGALRDLEIAKVRIL